MGYTGTTYDQVWGSPSYSLSSGGGGTRTISGGGGSGGQRFDSGSGGFDVRQGTSFADWMRAGRQGPGTAGYSASGGGLIGSMPSGAQAGVQGGVATRTSQTSNQYSAPWVQSAPGPHYQDLIARYQDMMGGGGAAGIQSEQDRELSKNLEMIRNTQAARGLGGRSGVGVAAASQYLGEAGPRNAAQRAYYSKGLIGDYAGAVGMGRTQYGPPMQTGSSNVQQYPWEPSGGSKSGQPEFAYQESRPGYQYSFSY